LPAKYSKSVPQQKLFREEARKQKAELKEAEKAKVDADKRKQRNKFIIEKLDEEGKDFIDLSDKHLDFLADESNPDTAIRDKARAAIEEIALAPDESDRLVNQIKANNIKLVTPAQARKLGLAETGEIESLYEALPKKFFKKDGLNLDQVAEQLRELGFDTPTGNDVINLIGDDLRASKARGVYPTFKDKVIELKDATRTEPRSVETLSELRKKAAERDEAKAKKAAQEPFKPIDQRKNQKRGAEAIIRRLETETKFDPKFDEDGNVVELQVSRQEKNEIEDMVNALPGYMTDTIALGISNESPTADGTYQFGADIIKLFRNQRTRRKGFDRTFIHEMFHHLSQWVSPETRNAVIDQYIKDMSSYVRENPWFQVFVGRDSISKAEYDAITDFNALDKDFIKNFKGNTSKIYDSSGKFTGRYRLSFSEDNYRFKNVDEWFAENMADEYMGRRAKKRDNQASFSPSVKNVIKAFKNLLDIIKDVLRKNFKPSVADKVFNDIFDFDFKQRRKAAPLVRDNPTYLNRISDNVDTTPKYSNDRILSDSIRDGLEPDQIPDPDGLDPVRDKEIVEVKPNDKKSSLRVSNIFQPIKSFNKKYLTSKGNLPDDAFSAMLRKQGRVGEATVRAKQIIKRYELAVGKLPKDMQTNIHARVNEVMSGNADSSILPEAIRDTVMDLRRTIDSMSNDLIKNGVVYGDLKDKVEGNIGHYLHRSYRKFDDPNWAKKVPEQVKNDAYNFMAQRMRAQMIQELSDRQYLDQNPDVKNVTSEVRETLEWAQIAQSMIDNKSLQPDHADVQGMIEWVLSKDAGGMESFIKAPSKQGSKDLRIFKQRKEIPKPIRALMGEYTDARINFFQSFVKMATLESAHLFQQEFKQAGLGKYLFESPKAGFATQIASEDSKVMSPLNISEVDEDGNIITKPIFTSPEIADAMKHVMEPGSLDGVAGYIYSKWMMLNGITKMSKTVLSVPTQMLNFWSNFTFMVANGHYDVKQSKKTFDTLYSQLTSKGGKDAQELVQRLTRLGVFGTTVNVNEINDIFKRAGLEKSDIAEFTDGIVKKTVKAPVNAALKMYQAGDEFFKAFAFLNEHARWSEIRPDLSSSEIDSIVADRIRNTLPSYDMVPRLVQNIRKTGVIGTFVSFPAEAIRTAFHTIRYAIQDIFSGNDLQKKEGYRRLIGIGFAASFTKGIQMASMSMSGISDDEAEELRHHQPEWNENSDFMYLPQSKKGEYRMIDVTRWNPHGLEVKVANAIMSGEDPMDALKSGMKEILEPFGTLTIQADAATKIIELMRSDEFAVQSPTNQTSEIAEIIWKAYGPTTLTQLQKVYLASEQLDIQESDRALNLKDEMTAFLGTRPVSRNISKSMMFKGFAYQKARRNISSEYRNLVRQPGSSQAAIDKAYNRQEELRRDLFNEMSKRVNNAIRYLGVTKAQVKDRLKNDANMSKRDIDDLFNNTYTPLKRRGRDKKK